MLVNYGKLQIWDYYKSMRIKILTDGITESLLDKNGYWVPITYRSRIIVYSNERVQENELTTYEDLADSKWKGRILVRSSSNSYNQALLSSLSC